MESTPEGRQASLSSASRIAHLCEPNLSVGVKRKVEEDEKSPQAFKSTKIYTEHEIHWKPDGSLLLQIKSTRFRLHKSRLMAESPWFEALIDQRAGVVDHEEPYCDQDEINRVLATAETVDGMDLFYLDQEDFPDIEEFAMLLTAMDCAITYIHNPLKLNEVVSLLRAANFYRMQQYESFCKSYILDSNLFVDKPLVLYRPPGINLAIQGVLLGRRYQGLSTILRPSFYDLARTRIIDENTLLGEDGRSKQSDEQFPESEEADFGLMEKVPYRDFIVLLNLQKRFMAAWCSIWDIMKYYCQTGRCSKHHDGTENIVAAQRKWPCDPISGIQHILYNREKPLESSYSNESAKVVQRRLIAEEMKIWADINVWLRVD